jgi:outer membrane lipoprotein-sorting protein
MKIIFSLFYLIYSTIGFAQSAESVLKALQDKFDSVNDLSVDVTQNSNGISGLNLAIKQL